MPRGGYAESYGKRRAGKRWKTLENAGKRWKVPETSGKFRKTL
jgi:hypothetical protein